ncbi:DUF3152 domain-containing protein [Micromonospora sp. NPDC049559]|uniref:DUF3152 domain-containing protein n=1 Tax=Micromonospora sp. NPDC049559 TaxID=3155923 RepID=UPI0034450CA8
MSARRAARPSSARDPRAGRRRAEGRRGRSRSRRLLLPAVTAVALGLAVGVLGVTVVSGASSGPGAAGAATPTTGVVRETDEPSRSGRTPEPEVTTPAAPPPVVYPAAGPRTWRTVGGRSPVLGTAGSLLRFRVSVENGITGVTPEQFAEAVVTTLGDPRSWTAGGRWRLQRVGPGESANFTVYLATPATRGQLCNDASDHYTSCRNDDRVVINVARWAHGVSNYGAPLAEYRQYVVNHEVGHRLGHGHELCPGKGRVAPVMQQQTLGMHGCTANAWPMRDGRLYAGRSGQYDDPIPDTD